MNDCLFCKIIKGEIPASTIYEDDVMIVFLDINPLSNGHVLAIPKDHQRTLFDMDQKVLAHMLEVIKTIIFPRLQERLSIEGLTIVQNNYYGQEVPHFHIHLVPRYQDDMVDITRNTALLESTDLIFEKLKNNS